MKKPYVISFSGIDGSGKTTQMNNLYEYLSNKGFKVKTTKVQFSALEVIYEYCDRYFGDPCAYHELPPFIVRIGLAYDVTHHYLKIMKEVSEYDFLLCDRHKIDFIAYGMGYGCTKEEMEWVEKILSLVEEPNLIFYFDTELSLSQERILTRKEKEHRIDENIDILTKVRNMFEKIITNKENIQRINANNSKNEVFNEIKERFNSLFTIANNVDKIHFKEY
ncbi:dTMP kinase [Haliovirga abyssi]|uniref:Thymidylate kinase n=1 Tax=Haliovirga abyssi TaxID=2996794 RepID=A0AAU9D5S7_9FUSO|nr:hypothetical protein [Haliovirga abyssi]BDU51334.1 thymidylate kinase [Haliovirga abyssi]